MADMTVNEVRVKLGKIIDKVFTESFAETYETTMPQVENSIPDILLGHLDTCDAYIKVISEELQYPSKIESINLFTHPLVVVCVFMRYHLITQSLMARNQDEKVIMPSDSKNFFREMFITYWKSLYPFPE